MADTGLTVCVIMGIILTGSGIYLVKKKTMLAIFGFLLLCILFVPIFLNIIITCRWYVLFPWQSALDEHEWFSFLGSYLGMGGTVIVGAIAYGQTKAIQQQEKKIRALEEAMMQYQICPAIHFKEVCIRDEGLDLEEHFINRRRLQDYYFKFYGLDFLLNDSDFVCIVIQWSNDGIIPVENITVKKIEWKINGQTYEIHLRGFKKRAFGTGEIDILIDRGDVEGEECFFDEIRKQRYFPLHRGAGSDKSELSVSMEFMNQYGKSTEYNLKCRIIYDRKNKRLDANNFFVIKEGTMKRRDNEKREQ